MRNPALVFLADQMDASIAERERVLAGISKVYGGQAYAELPPFAVGLLSQLADRYAAGTTDMCPHLSLRAPQPGYWAPWASGRIRCVSCFTKAGLKRLTGTRADRTCDSCGRSTFRGVLRMASVCAPGAVVDLEGVGGFAWPPVTIVFGLCPSCVDSQGLA
jgi:hypothetical protein